MKYPRLDVDCTKVCHNAQYLMAKLALRNISVTPVTKVFSGHPIIAQMLIDAGAEMVADSRVENIQRLTKAGVLVPKMLIRTPMLSQVTSVVKWCDISLNTEIDVIEKLSCVAKQLNITHGIVVMIELGDLREGVMPELIIGFIKQIIDLPNIIIKGIGANLACRYGIATDEKNMSLLSNLADDIEAKFDLKLDIISGGNTASIDWAINHTSTTRVNNLRIGEAIFLGFDSLTQEKIEGLYTDSITLTAEVIESKLKPSLPWGSIGANAFGEKEYTSERGAVSQAILALGRQDVCITGLSAPDGMTIMSSTSDHLIIETSGKPLLVGQTVMFNLDYSALLSSMSSCYVYKYFNKHIASKVSNNAMNEKGKVNATIALP
ncbi:MULTISPECIES: alanine/ornithine racemase family PLP-dependent enzyme [unclassified Pseudoalteromonas]|uniref:alanine/ornithine racemase family PLP-dependent enzyme n=1 Tax=unclassified Pseudoalteromonas TaxID=194690 RepID=UPI0009E2ACF2|nr:MULTISPECIES: alanine/ornithine racemase family PLP-dependent enzyme [unclassified Pseudoalteromonas]